MDVLDRRIGEELDLRIRSDAVEHDFRGAERVAAVDERPFTTEAAQEIRFFRE